MSPSSTLLVSGLRLSVLRRLSTLSWQVGVAEHLKMVALGVRAVLEPELDFLLPLELLTPSLLVAVDLAQLLLETMVLLVQILCFQQSPLPVAGAALKIQLMD